jgi:hypothetical protein
MAMVETQVILMADDRKWKENLRTKGHHRSTGASKTMTLSLGERLDSEDPHMG